MGTTADKLNKILETKEDLKAALIEKGQSVSDDDTFASYPDKVRAIETGGGGITPSGTITITTNGTHDVTNYATAEVNVPTESGGGSSNLIVVADASSLPDPSSVSEGTYAVID